MECEQVFVTHSPDNYMYWQLSGHKLRYLHRKSKISQYFEFLSCVKVQIVTCRSRLTE